MLTILSLPFRIVFWLLRAIFTPWYLRWMFRLPWFVYIACAAGLGYLAYTEYETYLNTLEGAYDQALSQPPATVPLSQFDGRTDTGLNDEINVSGLYFSALPNGTIAPSGLERSFLLLADDRGREVAAALVGSASDLPGFRAMLTAQGNGDRFAVTVNGTLSRNQEWARLIDAQVAALGLPTSDTIVIIEPFVGDRFTAIVDETDDDYALVLFLAGLAGLIGLVGLGKLALSAKGTDTPQPAPRPAPVAPPASPQTMPAASPWGGTTTPSRPSPAKQQPKRAPRKPDADPTPPSVPEFVSVFPGGGSGFRFKSADEIIRQSFGTVSRLTPLPSDTTDKDP